MPDYTLLVVLSLLAVVALEFGWLRTGIFATSQYWVTMLIVLAFQVPVDGYLTRLSDPVVIYAETETLGVRWPLDIPIEDFGFGIAMVTLTLLLWVRVTRRRTA